MQTRHLFLHIILVLIAIGLTACSRGHDEHVQGYVEGDYLYLSSPVPGRIVALSTERGSYVKKGQVLATLEPEPDVDAYRAAEAALVESQAAKQKAAADLVYAKLTYERNQTLVKKRVIQQAELDQAKAQYEALAAEVAAKDAAIQSAKATAAQAAWKAQQKIIVAPRDSLVFDKYYQVGEWVDSTRPIYSLLPSSEVKAIFYVPEKLLSSLKLNEAIQVKCDGANMPITGNISYISNKAEYTPPVIYSNETNSKLIFRIEAKFSDEDAKKLHPGQPIQVVLRLPGFLMI